ncbi:serine hydrolase domain-containing protein [Chengkuizengella sp. SCS-71B]|uniref:serine hydrolase domain-containing protein n=1 Tax=Chengkuizengella sp. SCS-71B TaxID=3115290 RepID=UPI0032C234D5
MKTATRNYWPTKEWKTIEPISVGIEPKKLTELEERIKSSYKNINGIVVVRKGYVAFEKYYNGYSLLDTHNVASVTKSIISALIGIAIDSEYIKSVDQKVLDFFPEYVTSGEDIPKRAVTIKQLLTMTAPFAFSWKGNQGGKEPLDRMRRQRDWVKYSLDLMGGKAQSGVFQYSTAGTHLLSAIITRITGKSSREFANEHLFKPIGMKEIPDHEIKSYTLDNVFGKNVTGWIKDPSGNSSGGFGLTLTPRDMARFGFLYLNRGNWNNKQMISEKWIEESTTMHSETMIDKTMAKYGYLWWLREEAGNSMSLALGDGGNVICCNPEKDLVVVIASKIVKNSPDKWPLIKEYVLPALIN